jgi:hypothetical protein
VARPIQPDLGSLPGFPLPETTPTLPGTAILDPDLPLDPVETFPLGPSRIAEIWAIRQQDPSLRIQVGDPLLDGIISPQRQKHILYGDGPGSGGHLSGVGQPGKTEFPSSWPPEKILEVIAELATRPGLGWKQQDGSGQGTIHMSPPGPILTNTGKPVRYQIVNPDGTLPNIEGVEIKVIIEPEREGVITGFPESGPGVIRNP